VPRPLKAGLDYFSIDVHFEEEMELIEAEYGLEGLAIIIKLWQKIYSKGYYIEWSGDSELLFSKKINTERNRVNDVINTCFSRNIFNKSMYLKYNILTSTGIQKRYLTACSSSKRKNIVFEERYLLLNNEYKRLITELIPLIPEETQLNQVESTQRKGKESKVKESKKEYAEFVTLKEIEYQKLVEKFGQAKADDKIETLNLWKGSKGKKTASDYMTILDWDRRDQNKNGGVSNGLPNKQQPVKQNTRIEDLKLPDNFFAPGTKI
jgi:hypothetical protein